MFSIDCLMILGALLVSVFELFGDYSSILFEGMFLYRFSIVPHHVCVGLLDF